MGVAGANCGISVATTGHGNRSRVGADQNILKRFPRVRLIVDHLAGAGEDGPPSTRRRIIHAGGITLIVI